jgi:hypothetical protein
VSAPFTILDAGQVTAVEATTDAERVLVGAAGLEAATGWEYKPEGLCRGPVCVPVHDRDFAEDGNVDLVAFARILRRPLALSVGERVAALGAPVADRHEQLGGLEAPEFALPDLDGQIHRLSELRGRKVLLAAYASW